MLVVVHHIYLAYSNYVLVLFWSFFGESIIFLRSWNQIQDAPIIMKIFIWNHFSETPWNQSNHSIAKERFHFSIDIMKKLWSLSLRLVLLFGLQSFRCRLIGVHLLDLLSPSPPLRIQLLEVSVQSLLSPCDRTTKCFRFVHEVCAVNVIILS